MFPQVSMFPENVVGSGNALCTVVPFHEGRVLFFPGDGTFFFQDDTILFREVPHLHQHKSLPEN